MNKALKLVLLSAVVATAGFATYKVIDSNEAEDSARSKENNKEKITEDSGTAPENENVKKEPVSADTLNSQDTKKAGKTVVLFKDGTTITDEDIKKELDEVPEQLSEKMSLAEIKSFLAWKNAYKKVMTEVAQRSGVTKSKEISELIEKKKKIAAGFMLLNEKADEMMTPEALKANYDKVWDKNFKGTKEFSLTAVTTSEKALADIIKKKGSDRSEFDRILDTNASKIKRMEMDSRPQGMFPQEITSAVLKQGAGTIVGPFELKGMFMLFYVKSINDAKKREFTSEFAEEYKKAARKDFVKAYTETLYKKYDVKVKDSDGKTVDPFMILAEKDNKKQNEKQLVKLSKLASDAVIATYKSGSVTVNDLKEFYKVETLLDKTFVAMSKQFGISLDKVIIYATKLMMDDIVLRQEVDATNYTTKPEVVSKMQEVADIETQHAYYKERVKVKSEDIKKAYSKFIKSIPEEDKNDNEISVKIALYQTREDAALDLKGIVSGESRFSNVYKEKLSKHEAVDLGYITKRATPSELWMLLKTGASGACIKQVVELKGSQFGMPGKDFGVIYIADRRPITLPSLSNDADKEYFKRLAERERAIELAKSALINGIEKIEGKSIHDLIKANPGYVERVISILLGYAG